MAKVAEKSVWHKLLDGKYSRRTVLQSVIAAGVAGGLKVADAQGELDTGGAQVANNGAPAASVGGTLQNRPPFTPIDMNFADTLTLPEGYSYQFLAPWGEVLNEAGDEIGFNHDFVGFFPIDMLEGGSSSEEGILTINHEYPICALCRRQHRGPHRARAGRGGDEVRGGVRGARAPGGRALERRDGPTQPPHHRHH